MIQELTAWCGSGSIENICWRNMEHLMETTVGFFDTVWGDVKLNNSTELVGLLVLFIKRVRKIRKSKSWLSSLFPLWERSWNEKLGWGNDMKGEEKKRMGMSLKSKGGGGGEVIGKGMVTKKWTLLFCLGSFCAGLLFTNRLGFSSLALFWFQD